jgi:hypothetical protein
MYKAFKVLSEHGLNHRGGPEGSQRRKLWDSWSPRVKMIGRHTAGDMPDAVFRARTDAVSHLGLPSRLFLWYLSVLS